MKLFIETMMSTVNVTEIETKLFTGGEIHVDISELPKVCLGYTLTARCQNSHDIMQMMMVADALYRRYPTGTGKILIPYMPYSRQDRKCADGHHFGMEVLANMLNNLPQEIVTYDMHSAVGFELLDEAHEIEQYDIIESDNDLVALINMSQVRLVSPDNGAESKTMDIYETCGGLYPAFGEKVRDPETGNLTGFDVDVEDFKGKDVLIVDDICDGGGTFIGLAEVLKERNCGKISLYVTHGIFSRGFDIFKGRIDNIITTNTFRRYDSYSNTSINMHGLDLRVIELV